VPTEKRELQRAGARARREALARQQKRRRRVRSSFVVVIIAAVVIGSLYLITKKSPTVYPNTAQGKLEAVWAKAGCPTTVTGAANTLQFKTAPPLTISTTATYDATVKTDVGTFVISLNPKEAPKTVNSFVFLAKQGFFNCNSFHRVVKDFIVQTGDPTGTGDGGPGYSYKEQGPSVASPQYPLGSIAMATASTDSTDPVDESQWFIVTGPEGEDLPPDYTLFGQVTSGMSVVQEINKGGSASTSEKGTPTLVHRILSVKVKEA
jgi:cyclophilin family peptidyl-prolyl cis-trans isomerase